MPKATDRDASTGRRSRSDVTPEDKQHTGIAPGSTEARIMLLEAQLSELLHRQAIRDLVMEYGRSVDARDWEAHRALFCSTIEVDFASMPGVPGAMRVSRDDWIAQLGALFGAIPATQHITNLLAVEIDGQHAHAVALLHAQHYKPNGFGEPVQRVIGTYNMWLNLGADGWLICQMVSDVKWNEGNFWIFSSSLPSTN